jgi:hypothetical protein
MRKLVRNESPPPVGFRLELALPEEDVPSDREGFRADTFGQLIRACVAVDANRTEVCSEPRLHERSGRLWKRFATSSSRSLHLLLEGRTPGELKWTRVINRRSLHVGACAHCGESAGVQGRFKNSAQSELALDLLLLASGACSLKPPSDVRCNRCLVGHAHHGLSNAIRFALQRIVRFADGQLGLDIGGAGRKGGPSELRVRLGRSPGQRGRLGRRL